MNYKFIDTSKKLNIIALVTFIGVFLLVFGIRKQRLHSSQIFVFNKGAHLYLESDKNIDELIDALKLQDVRFSPKNTEWFAKIYGWKKFKKGHYYLHDNYSGKELLSKIGLGNEDPLLITILPGQTHQGFVTSLASQIIASEEDIHAQLADSLYLKELELTQEQLFGRLLPETYNVYWSSSPKKIIDRMLTHFDEVVANSLKSEIEKSEYSLDEILTLASIVELEAANEVEKPTISGLYINRLKRNMPLQADPTVSFAVGERRRLYFKDYEVDHPFNTYRNRGLPPGPITNPKLSSIKAVLNPEHHNYLYMVATPDGKHTFTSSFEQHKIESDKYRKWLQEQQKIKEENEI